MPVTYGVLMRDGINYSHDTAESITYTSGSSTQNMQTILDDLSSSPSIPTGGTTNKFLRGDLTWDTPNNTTYPIVSTASAGLVRKLTDTTTVYLRGDGTWATPTNTTYGVATTAANGLVRSGGTSAKYLRGDGTWQTPPNTTYAVMTSGTTGLAPSGGSTDTFLRGDATWDTPNNTTYPIVSTTSAGLVRKLTGETDVYLRGDGTWTTPTDDNDEVLFHYWTRADSKAQNRTEYPFLSYNANDTTETNYVRTGRLMLSFSSTTDYMYAGDGSNTWWYIATDSLRVNNRSWIHHAAAQQLDIKSDTSGTGYQNYGIQLGVYDSAWCFKGGNNGYVGFGSPSHKWSTIYATNGTINTSDRNQKEDIIDLTENAKDFIMDLKPVSYKFKNMDDTDHHDRTHYGLIAQDVEDTMTKLGMTALDFGGFCKDQKMEEYEVPSILENGEVNIDPDGNPLTVKKQRPIEGEYIYGLRYDEFISPIIKTIQIRQEKLNEQEELIQLLEARIAQLENV